MFTTGVGQHTRWGSFGVLLPATMPPTPGSVPVLALADGDPANSGHTSPYICSCDTPETDAECVGDSSSPSNGEGAPTYPSDDLPDAARSVVSPQPSSSPPYPLRRPRRAPLETARERLTRATQEGFLVQRAHGSRRCGPCPLPLIK